MITFWAAAVAASLAAGAAGNWRDVEMLERGSDVVVLAADGRTVYARVTSADADALMLVDAADPERPDGTRLVRRYAREAIVEVRMARPPSHPVACGMAAYFGGALIGGLPGAVVGGLVGRDSGPALVGMAAGWTLGGTHVYRKCRAPSERVIYRAPVVP
jgi:hypothetical protein